MTPIEAGALFRIAKAAFAHQKFDEYTPDVWAEALAELTFTDARAAVMQLEQTQSFISAADIRLTVKRARAARLANVDQIQPPPDLDPDDVSAWLKWKRDTIQAIADGAPEPPPIQLASHPMPAALSHVFRRP